MKNLQQLSKFGSANTPPVLLCLKATEKPTEANYDKAIEACRNEGFLHLQAMMNEHCGLLFLDDNNPEEGKRFLTRALWIYYDWGAMGKVAQLRKRHRFLHGSRRSERTPNALLNFVVNQMNFVDEDGEDEDAKSAESN